MEWKTGRSQNDNKNMIGAQKIGSLGILDALTFSTCFASVGDASGSNRGNKLVCRLWA
jgi:hypothetical protein